MRPSRLITTVPTMAAASYYLHFCHNLIEHFLRLLHVRSTLLVRNECRREGVPYQFEHTLRRQVECVCDADEVDMPAHAPTASWENYSLDRRAGSEATSAR